MKFGLYVALAWERLIAKLPLLRSKLGLAMVALGVGALLASVASAAMVELNIRGSSVVAVSWLSIALAVLAIVAVLLYLGVTIGNQRISGRGLGTLSKLATLYPELNGVIEAIRSQTELGLLKPKGQVFKRHIAELEVAISIYLDRHRRLSRWSCIWSLLSGSACAILSFSGAYIAAFVISMHSDPRLSTFAGLLEWIYFGVESAIKNASSFDIDANLPVLVRSVALFQNITVVTWAGTLIGMLAAIASDPVDATAKELTEALTSELRIIALNQYESKES